MLNKKTVVKKAIEVGGFTLCSRFLGIIREMLLGRYLGASGLADVFITAYKIPNSLRKIFAEGALSAAFVPTLVAIIQSSGKKAVRGLMVVAFLVFESMVIILCVAIIFKAEHVVQIIAPGFSPEQILTTIPNVKVITPFIFFLSSSALLAGVLQACGHFFIPAFSPVLLNIVLISALVICLLYQLPIIYLCWFILGGGLLQFIAHLIAYSRLRIGTCKISKKDIILFRSVFIKFLLCLPSVSITELSLFIDTSFASYLHEGSISLLYYANRFVGIPVGVFAVSLSTILLPHFSRIGTYAPKRLHFYLLESAKLVLWVTFPATILMSFFSEKIFYTIFLSQKFTLAHVHEASHILCAYLIGLYCISLNKVLLAMYYALHVTWIPSLIDATASVINIVLDYLFLEKLQSFGLALATSISSIVRSLLFVIILAKKYAFRLYIKEFVLFTLRYSLQLLVCIPLFIGIFHTIEQSILYYASPLIRSLFLDTIGFWLWVTPLVMLLLFVLWWSRSYFKLRIYFLEK